MQRDGKIVAAGFSGGNFALVRYTTSGKLDTSFGSGGKVLSVLAPRSEADAVALQTDGRIVAAGWSYAKGNHDFALVRYTTAGKLDASFGSGGKVLTDLGRGDHRATGLAIQKDGKIFVAGYSDAVASNDFAVVRYTDGGKLDRSFGSGGKVLTDLRGGSDDRASAIAIQEDKIVAAGLSVTSDRFDFALARYMTNGKLDTSFGGGRVLTDLGGDLDWALALAVQQDGRIVTAGYSNADGSDDFALVRYTK